ncbi:MAG: Ku protein [Steroidobacteraceae bacterium]
MPRAIWRGAVSFGLIYVPVDVISASKDGSLSLHYLDSRDFSPVGYQRINKSTGKEVDWAHIVKGYEYEKGRYVALSDADFKHANVKACETIEIANFTDVEQIPPMYYETPYYLSPQKGGQKVYSLLRQALQSTGKVALGTFVMRGRQHLCVIVANGEVLMLITLRFANEVLTPAVVKEAVDSGRDKKATPAEIAMARKLVEQMSGPFRPAAFKDSYRADLMRRIQEKIRTKQTHALAEEAPPAERPKAQVIDLMQALRGSLRKQGAPARAAPRKSSKARKRA